MKLLPAALGLLVTVAGCTDTGPTGASQDATTEVRVAGDAPQGGQASRSASGSESSATIEGSVHVRAQVYLQSETGEWVRITGGGAAEQTVDATGEGGFQVLARSEVDAVTYQRIRIEFEDVRADLEGALALQLGSGLVAVEIGSGGRAVVERSIAFRARTGTVSRVDIDLNAPQWIGTADGGVVARSAFESAVVVTAQ